MANGYVQRRAPGHPRATGPRAVIQEHVLVASRAMGKPVPVGAEVHHVNGDKSDNRPENLVVCEDRAYHMLLHQRQEALRECGNADWRRCKFCKRFDAPENLYIPPSGWGPRHRKCFNEYRRSRKATKGRSA